MDFVFRVVQDPLYSLLVGFFIFIFTRFMIFLFNSRIPSGNRRVIFWKWTDRVYYYVGGISIVVGAIGFSQGQIERNILQIEKDTDIKLVQLESRSIQARVKCDLQEEPDKKDQFLIQPKSDVMQSAIKNRISLRDCQISSTIISMFNHWQNIFSNRNGRYGGLFIQYRESVPNTNPFNYNRWTDVKKNLDIFPTFSLKPIDDFASVLSDFEAEYLDNLRSRWESYQEVINFLSKWSDKFRLIAFIFLGIAFALRLSRITDELKNLQRSSSR